MLVKVNTITIKLTDWSREFQEPAYVEPIIEAAWSDGETALAKTFRGITSNEVPHLALDVNPKEEWDRLERSYGRFLRDCYTNVFQLSQAIEREADKATDLVITGQRSETTPFLTVQPRGLRVQIAVTDDETGNPQTAIVMTEIMKYLDKGAPIATPAAATTCAVKYVKGVGDALEKKFHDQGIETVVDLAAQQPDALAELTKSPAHTILNAITNAQKIIDLAEPDEIPDGEE